MLRDLDLPWPHGSCILFWAAPCVLLVRSLVNTRAIKPLPEWYYSWVAVGGFSKACFERHIASMATPSCSSLAARFYVHYTDAS